MYSNFWLQYDNVSYCVKCGRIIPQVGGWIQVSTYDALGRILPIYGTACCKADMFNLHDTHWDYCDTRPLSGERVESQNLTQLVKLCCSIGKSPKSIRMNLRAFYFDIKSAQHRSLYHQLVDKLLQNFAVHAWALQAPSRRKAVEICREMWTQNQLPSDK